MPSVNLQLLNASNPISVEWHSKAGDDFQASLSDGSIKGRLIWLSSTSGLLILNEIDGSESLPKSEGGSVYPFYKVEESASRLSLWVDGQLFVMDRISQEPRRAGASNARTEVSDGKLRAPLPGRVLKVLVSVGDSVEVGAPLVTLESMKMETTLTAPMKAQVSELFIAPDSLVDKGAVLLSLNPEENEA